MDRQLVFSHSRDPQMSNNGFSLSRFLTASLSLSLTHYFLLSLSLSRSLTLLLSRSPALSLSRPHSLPPLLLRCCCSQRAEALRASWLQKDVVPELWPGPMHQLGSHHALRACGAFLAALQVRDPLVVCSCPLRKPPGHPRGPISYPAAYPRCGGFLHSWCGAYTLAWRPCPYVLLRSTRLFCSCKREQYYRARSVAERQGGHEACRLVHKTITLRLCSL